MSLLEALSRDLEEHHEWTEGELKLIELAQSQLNDVETLEKLLESESAIVPGSRGAPRLNALFTELRGSRLAAARIISLLKIQEEKPGRGNRSPQARARI